MKTIIITLLITAVSICAQNIQYNVKIIDFIKATRLDYNSAGPHLIQTDEARNRIVVANSLSSTVSVIDASTDKVTNIPVSLRSLQHLKNEAMTINKRNGIIYLIGDGGFSIINPETKKGQSFQTSAQMESIVVDESTGNAFMCSRESSNLLFFDAKQQKLSEIPWLEQTEKLQNTNSTPAPPIRKLIPFPLQNRIIAIDGLSSTLFQVNAETGQIHSSRKLPLTAGGRWHLCGFNQTSNQIYIVTETSSRKVSECCKIDALGNNDILIKLPQFTEGSGMQYHPDLDLVLIPYDNHPTVHVVDFQNSGAISEIAVPAFGNDASYLDVARSILYIGSWHKGEVHLVDIKTRKFVKKITDVGILPHMFAMTFNPRVAKLYFAIGATGVNGIFGSAIVKLDPELETWDKINLGWSPIDMIEVPYRRSFLIFNSEDEMCEVKYDGSSKIFKLPFSFPITAHNSPDGMVYLSYGPHQSYWPAVYIWGAKNGILKIDVRKQQATGQRMVMMDSSQLFDFTPKSFYDRRIPRQAQKIILDKNGVLYMTQNAWGKEPQFINILKDEVRELEIGDRIITGDTVERETTQRLMAYDESLNRLYIARTAEEDSKPGILQIISLEDKKVIKSIEVGLNPVDLIFDEQNIYIANFESNSITVINKSTFNLSEIPTEQGPFRLVKYQNQVLVINNIANSIQEVKFGSKAFKVPYNGAIDNFIEWRGKIAFTVHSSDMLNIGFFDLKSGKFEKIYKFDYPYGDLRFNSGNSAFYMNGQFGDAVYDLSKMKIDVTGSLWITDFLAGRAFIIK